MVCTCTVCWSETGTGFSELIEPVILVNPGTFSFQLFDDDNPLHKSENKYIFTTEGHVVPIDARFREKQWNDLFPCEERVVTDQETSNVSFSINNINVMTSDI
jgi:hypothetical protein